MREVKEITETITRKVYVADDGTEYDTEYQCRYYDRVLRLKKAKKALEVLPKFNALPPHATDDDNEEEWTWVYLRCPEDLEAVKVAYYFTDDCSGIEYEPESYPCWILAYHSGIGYGFFASFEDVINAYQKFETYLRQRMEDELKTLAVKGEQNNEDNA